MTPDPLADVFPDTQDAPLPLWLHGRAELGTGAPRPKPSPEDIRWAPQRRDGERR